MNERPNPYVGPRPFEADELLPARDREVLELRRTLISARIVLLHSPSGAGKTSLLAAKNGLRRAMTERQFLVRPTARVNQPAPPGSTRNRYELSVLRSLAADEPTDIETLAGLGLVDWLAAHQEFAEGERRRRELLIFDQFEEILTADPTDDRGRTAFFTTLAAVLDDPYRWALFLIRDDYLGALEPWARLLPTHLDTRFRIDLLSPDGARAAIRSPAAAQGVEFASDALEHLVGELRRVVVQGLDGRLQGREGLWIEPVQLQVVCRRLWSRLASDDLLVELHEVKELGDVDAALAGFYAEQVRAIAAGTGVGERQLRGWIGTRLISPQGIRTQVMRGEDSSEGMANRVIAELERAHLVRGEERRGVKWFELAHDRLVAPIRRDNEAWERDNLHPMQIQAALWERQGEPHELLLGDDALEPAETWAWKHTEATTELEGRFLQRSREAAAGRANKRRIAAALAAEQQRRLEEKQRAAAALAEEQQRRLEEQQRAAAELAEAQRQRLAEQARRLRQLRLGAAVLGLAFVASVGLGVYAWKKSKEAEKSAAEEAQAKRAAVEATQVAVAAATKARAQGLMVATHNADGDPTLQAALLREIESPESMRGWLETAEELASKPIAVDVFELEEFVEPADLGWFSGGVRVLTLRSDERMSLWADDPAKDGGFLLFRPDATSPPDHVRVHGPARFSPDGRLAAALTRMVLGTDAAMVRVWRAESDDVPLAEFPATTSTALAFAQDALVFAGSATEATLVEFRDDGTTRTHSFAVPAEIRGLALSPRGTRVAVGTSEPALRVWQVGDPGGPLVLKDERDIVFAPDERLAVTLTAEGAATVRRLDDPAAEPRPLSAEAGVQSALYSPDGSLLVTHHRNGKTIAWSPDGREKRRTFSTSDAPPSSQDPSSTKDRLSVQEPGSGPMLSHLRFSPDGTHLLGIGEGKLHLWRARDARKIPVLPGGASGVESAVFSPGGDRVLVLSGRVLRSWPIAPPIPSVLLRGQAFRLEAATFSADGRRVLASGMDDTVRVWAPEDGQVKRISASRLRTALFSPDGKWVLTASADGALALWPSGSEGTRVGLVDPPRTPMGNKPSLIGDKKMYGDSPGESARQNLTSAAFSPDGSRVLYVVDGVVRLVATDGVSTPVTLDGHGAWVRSAAFSPDGARVVSLSFKNEIRIGGLDDAGEARRIASSETEIQAVRFSPDGLRVLASQAGAAILAHTDGTGEAITFRADEHEATRSRPRTLAPADISADGTRVLVAGRDNAARIFQVGDPARSLVLAGKDSLILDMHFSPDGTHVVTAHEDGTAKVWRADGRGPGIDLVGHEKSVTAAEFSPDGTRVVTASADGTARVWQVPLDLKEFLWRRTSFCVPPPERVVRLGEDPEEAGKRHEACLETVRGYAEQGVYAVAPPVEPFTFTSGGPKQ